LGTRIECAGHTFIIILQPGMPIHFDSDPTKHRAWRPSVHISIVN
jgi:hypothetical protein